MPTAKKPASKKAPAKKAASKKAPAKKPAAKKAPATTAAPDKMEPGGMVVSTKGTKTPNAEFEQVALKDIHEVKGFNPRAALGDVSDLQRSIKANGLIHPLVVRPRKSGGYNLVAGARRLSALTALKFASVPVLIRTDLDDDARALSVAVAENSEDGRTNLTHLEMGETFAKLQKAGYKVEVISKECGVAPHTVRRCLQIVEAPKPVRDRVQSGDLSLIGALEIAKLSDNVQKSVLETLDASGWKKPSASGDKEVKFSALDVKRLAKDSAREEGAISTGAKVQKKKGATRDASLAVPLKMSEVRRTAYELCYYLQNPDPEDVGTPDFYELRGAAAVALYVIGEWDDAMAPPADPNEVEEVAEAKKALARFNALVESFAGKFTPEGEGEEEEAA